MQTIQIELSERIVGRVISMTELSPSIPQAREKSDKIGHYPAKNAF